jgi:uridine kinase
MNEIEIRLLDGSRISLPYGTRAEALSDRFGPLSGALVAFRANNEIVPIATRLEVNTTLEPVTLDTKDGAMVYRRSLSFLLAVAARELFPDQGLYVGHSLGNGYFYSFANEYKPSVEDVASLDARMREIVKEDLPIGFRYIAYADALEVFTRTVRRTRRSSGATKRCEGARQRMPGIPGPLRLAPGAAHLHPLLLRAASLRERVSPALPTRRRERHSPFGIARASSRSTKNTKVGTHRRVNAVDTSISSWIPAASRASSMIAEAFQEKKLPNRGQDLRKTGFNPRDPHRGPVQLRKTTTAKRLSIHSRSWPGTHGDRVGRLFHRQGKDAEGRKGEPDYECLEALDVPLLNQNLLALFRGEEVELPSFDFKTGARKESGKKMKLGRRTNPRDRGYPRPQRRPSRAR